jgi:hypothetical protein
MTLLKAGCVPVDGRTLRARFEPEKVARAVALAGRSATAGREWPLGRMVRNLQLPWNYFGKMSKKE